MNNFKELCKHIEGFENLKIVYQSVLINFYKEDGLEKAINVFGKIYKIARINGYTIFNELGINEMDNINELDIMLQNVVLGEKVNKLERELFLKEVELISLKEEEFNHIDISKVDLDTIEMLERVYKSMGLDGLKIWLLRFFPTPQEEKIKNHQSKLISEIPGLSDYLKNSKSKYK
ncbi:hypothetical protein [Planktothrix sp.]|uniref:hypothetical protein n=1 Tax=Planktothrix sp. TaxID=3088171 RepID=UPI0038D4D3AE